MISLTGLALKTNMPTTAATESTVTSLHQLGVAARRLVRDLDPTDDLVFLRTSTRSEEILVSPGLLLFVLFILIFRQGEHCVCHDQVYALYICTIIVEINIK